jgi:hypothetical protein
MSFCVDLCVLFSTCACISLCTALSSIVKFCNPLIVQIVAAFVPGVAIFNALRDRSCLPEMVHNNCHGEATCWQYNLDNYRYTSLGTTAVINLLSFAGFAAVYWVITSTGAKARDGRRFIICSQTKSNHSEDDRSFILPTLRTQDSKLGVLNCGVDTAILRENNFSDDRPP